MNKGEVLLFINIDNNFMYIHPFYLKIKWVNYLLYIYTKHYIKGESNCILIQKLPYQVEIEKTTTRLAKVRGF